MKKTKITMLLFLFMMAAKLNAQTCSSPLTRELHDNSWEFIDSTNTTDTWIKFTADNSYLIFKLKIFGYLGVESFTLYQNNCSPLTVVSTTNTVSNDTLTMITPSLTSGNDYLMKIINPNSPNYIKYILRKFLVVSNTTTLGCNTLTCSLPTGCELVCNGGFECVNQIPTNENAIMNGDCQNWTTPNGATSDLFSTSSQFNQFPALPCSGTGYTNPHLGNNVAGIIVNQSYPANWSEYLETKLLSQLQAGKTYSISFWVKKGTKYPLRVDELGIFLSSSQINAAGFGLITNTNYTVSASNSNTAILNDYANWNLVSYTYTAYGSEQFLTIGKTSTVTSSVTIAPPTFTQCLHSPNPNYNYLFIDDVSVKELPNATLSLPGNICQNQTVFLNPLATPGGGTFTGTGVTSSAGNYSFNANQNLSPGSYPIVYTFTFGTSCVQTATIGGTIVISNTLALTATASNYAICTNSAQTSSTLYVSSTYTGALTYTWLPSSANVSSLAISPTVSTIYTVSAIYLGCTYSTAVAITVNSACCTSTVPALNIGTFTSSVTYSNSPYVFNNDIVIGPGVTTTFYDAEYLFATNVKITVKNGASLVFYGSHLYGCNDMWQGIVVEDGGMVQIAGGTGTHDALFEDAIVGIDITNHTTSTITPSTGQILTVDKAVFNKNYIAIRINNYKRDFQPYPFVIRNSVFTSRSLTFTPTSWPTCSTTTGSMREATSSTVGLGPPYSLMGFTVTTLKSPYTLQSAHKGIELISVGTTTYPTTYKSIQIGSQANISDYNIFDALGHGIESINSNIYSLNNVFQNSQRYVINPYVSPSVTFGGNGISHITNNDFNSYLYMTPSGATSPTLAYIGNRFYNCHYGVNCDKVYNFNCRFATFRSTQTNTNTAFGPGNTGISLRSNRMFFIIDDNNFANINTAINVPIGVGTYSTNVSNYFGVNANCVQMNRNYIGAQITSATTPTNEYVNRAITVSFPLTTSLTNVTSSNFVIQSNTISNVYRGIEVIAMSQTNMPVQTSTNTISLRDDNTFTTTPQQWGIKMVNNGAGTIRSNTIIGASTTNASVSLFYSNLSHKDSVFCNDLSNAYEGFVFELSNNMNHWKGNKMTTLKRGMSLKSSGYIGPQGSTSSAVDNVWDPTTSWTSSNYGTYVASSSIASLSPLNSKNSGNYFPPNPGWDVGLGAQSYSNTASTPIATSGTFMCDVPVANPSNNWFVDVSSLENAIHKYITNSAMYRTYLLKLDEGLDPDLWMYADYFSTELSGTNVEFLFDAENQIQAGDLESAYTNNNRFEAANSVEYYSQSFNNIYINYLQEDYTEEDSTSLYNIANSCPGEYGPSVYQARALYNYIYSGAFNYIDDCDGTGEKTNPISEKARDAGKNKVEMQIAMFPNPASKYITFVGKGESNQILDITINDLSGKIVQNRKVKANERTEFELKNGMYFVTISNSKKEKAIKKLIISK